MIRQEDLCPERGDGSAGVALTRYAERKREGERGRVRICLIYHSAALLFSASFEVHTWSHPFWGGGAPGRLRVGIYLRVLRVCSRHVCADGMGGWWWWWCGGE